MEDENNPKEEKGVKEKVPKRKVGRPKSKNPKGGYVKDVFILKEEITPKIKVRATPKDTPKDAPKDKPKIDKPKKQKKNYTPEELAIRKKKQERRVALTLANRSKAFVQPWCATPLKFRNKVEEYFNTGANTYTIKKGDVEIEQKVYTWTGLAYYLGFSSRDSMNTFGNKPEFKEIVAKAKLVVERAYEEKLHSTNPAGGIFALKNFGWTDTSKTDLTITVNPLEKLMKAAGRRKLPPNITMVDDE